MLLKGHRQRTQRIERGFSDRDMWSADMYLAGVFADVLQWYIDNSHGVSMVYAYGMDPYKPDTDKMVRRRNRQYRKHIKVFREYAKNGHAWNKAWKKDFGGVLDKDIQKSLKWFSEHFSELWD